MAHAVVAVVAAVTMIGGGGAGKGGNKRGIFRFTSCSCFGAGRLCLGE